MCVIMLFVLLVGRTGNRGAKKDKGKKVVNVENASPSSSAAQIKMERRKKTHQKEEKSTCTVGGRG